MLGGFFDSVDAVAEFDNIHVELEYSLLRQQVFHQERVVRLQAFSDPGSALPEKQGTSALIGDR